MLKSNCPSTCLFPTGNYDCGLTKPIEGCHCLPGLVRDINNNCINKTQCGCLMPDNSGILTVKYTI